MCNKTGYQKRGHIKATTDEWKVPSLHGLQAIARIGQC